MASYENTEVYRKLYRLLCSELAAGLNTNRVCASYSFASQTVHTNPDIWGQALEFLSDLSNYTSSFIAIGRLVDKVD